MSLPTRLRANIVGPPNVATTINWQASHQEAPSPGPASASAPCPPASLERAEADSDLLCCIQRQAASLGEKGVKSAGELARLCGNITPPTLRHTTPTHLLQRYVTV